MTEESEEALDEKIKAIRREVAQVEQEILLQLYLEELEHRICNGDKDKQENRDENGTKEGTREGEKEKKMEHGDHGQEGKENISKEWDRKEGEYEIWKPPRYCIPINADVTCFDFQKLIQKQREGAGKLFDVIMTDPPWQLATSNPTRGVAIGYQQLPDSFIETIPFGELQENGFLFIWVINAKYKLALELMEKWGYTLVDEIVWVKRTVNRRLAKSHGFYLQHAKETCLVAKKGKDPPGTQRNFANDVLYAERRGQSQKPREIYKVIEQLVPNGHYLEIFARRNNLSDYWVSIGNEL